jgi:hypothetical protein
MNPSNYTWLAADMLIHIGQCLLNTNLYCGKDLLVVVKLNFPGEGGWGWLNLLNYSYSL